MISSGNYNNRDLIKNILLERGYEVQDCVGYLKCNALFRGGSDVSSVTIYDEKIIDHVTSTIYSPSDFLKLITNQVSDEKFQQFLQKNNIIINKDVEPKLKQSKIFDESIINELLPIYDYFLDRGVKEEVLRELKCGLYQGNIKYLNNRIVFPIFNSKNQIICLAGRDITNNNNIYWIIKGQKTNSVYPAFINTKDIKEKKSVFLVEGISDLLTLFSLGIRNVLVLFGTDLNLSILNYLLKINIDKIYVSTNNDILREGENNSAGNDAADKIAKKLRKYFNYNQVEIVLPQKYKDWSLIHQKLGAGEVKEQLKKYIN